MLRRFALLTLSTLLVATLLVGCTSLSMSKAMRSLQIPVAEAVSVANVACDVTQPFLDQPPDDPNADSFGFGKWHINAERTIWVAIPPSGVWHTGGEKAMWIRPAGTELQVSGQRLDDEATSMVVEQPCCYPTGFQVNALYFPTEGCWQVSATAGEHELIFVIEVRGDPLQSERRMRRGIDPTSPLAMSVLLQRCDARTCELQLHNTATGMAMSGYEPLSLGQYATFGPSNDLTQLAVIDYRNNTYLRNGKLSFVNLATWEVVTTTLVFDGAYNKPVFTPDNARLLVVTQTETWPATDTAYLVDVVSGMVLAEQALDFYPWNYQFTADGSAIMFYGIEGATNDSYVALLDAATLEMIWQAQVEGLVNGHMVPEGSRDPQEGVWWQPAAAFAPDRATLYIIHADKDQLTTVDYEAQSINTRPVTQPLSWVERLLMLTARTAHAKMANGVSKQAALSSDSSQLYVIGTHSSVEDGHYVQTGLGLQVIDIAAGEITSHIDTEAQSLTLDSVHGRLYLHGWVTNQTIAFTKEWTEVLDVGTLEQIKRIDKAVAFARRLDGTPILLSTAALGNGQIELAALDPQTFATISVSAESNSDYTGWIVLR